jgi:hypothetical protein
MPGRLRSAALAAAMAVAVLPAVGCSGGGDGPSVPLAMMRNGDELLVFIGKQCEDVEYPTRVRVASYDRAAGRATDPPLWEVTTGTPGLLPSISLGQPPPGFTEVVNNLAGRGALGTIEVDVESGATLSAIFDTGRVVEGQVLQSTGDVVSLESFRHSYGCPD